MDVENAPYANDPNVYPGRRDFAALSQHFGGLQHARAQLAPRRHGVQPGRRDARLCRQQPLRLWDVAMEPEAAPDQFRSLEMVGRILLARGRRVCRTLWTGRKGKVGRL